MSDNQIAVNRKKQTEQTEKIRSKLLQLVNEGKLTAALLERVDPKHFIQACMTHYLSSGSSMFRVDPLTFVKACVEAAQLGLKPDPVLGECYIIPRQISIKKPDKTWEKKWVAQFQMGYRGVAKLVRRSDQVRDISPHVAYLNDHFDVRLGTDGQIEHRPYYMLGKTEPGDVIAAYSVVTFKDGTKSFRVVPRYELDRAAEASGNPGDTKWSNVWTKFYGPMAMKTAMLRHAKWLPMPDDCMRAVNLDERREMGIPDDEHDEFIDATVVEGDAAQDGDPEGQPDQLDDLANNR